MPRSATEAIDHWGQAVASAVLPATSPSRSDVFPSFLIATCSCTRRSWAKWRVMGTSRLGRGRGAGANKWAGGVMAAAVAHRVRIVHDAPPSSATALLLWAKARTNFPWARRPLRHLRQIGLNTSPPVGPSAPCSLGPELE